MFEYDNSHDYLMPPEDAEPVIACPQPAVDEDVVARAQKGDQEAIADVFLQVWPLIQATVGYLERDRSQAEELALGALERVITRGIYGDGYRTRDNFGNWARRVTHNYAVDDYRHRTAALRLLPIEYPDIFDEAEKRAQSSDAATLALEAEAAQRITAAFDAAGIEETFRRPFLMYHLGKVPAKEIATMLGENPATIRTRIYRAEKKLKAFFKITADSPRRDIFTYPDPV